MKIRSLSHNIIVVLLYRLLLVMFLFSVCRVGFYFFNHAMFPGITLRQFMRILYGGLGFDLSGILYFNIFIIILSIIPFDFRYNKIYQQVVKYLFFIFNGLALAMNCADFVYYRFIQKRATSEVFKSFSHEDNITKLSFRFMADYWQATLLFFVMMILLIYFYKKLKPVKPEYKNKVSYHVINVILFLIIPGLFVAGVRGGFRHSTRPITISNAARFVDNPRDVAIVLNTPFSILRTWNKKPLKKLDYFPPEELTKYYSPVHTPHPSGPFRHYNVVVFILESFSKEYIGALNKNLDNGTYKGYTPFLDSLISVSKTFTVSIADGRKSIEAMPSVLASIPSLETPYIISPYANNKIQGLAKLLAQEGYYTAFFHGAPNGSMGFDSFANMAGFQDYYGKNQYPNQADFDGVWGIWDEPFFQFFEHKIDSFKKPFFVSIFSVSSHHPFKVPEKYEGKFKSGAIPILPTIGYTDMALREFFNAASKEPWFDSTLFVLTADHTNQLVHKVYQNDFGFYSVPIIFYQRGSDLKGMDDEIVEQSDIMPTILDYLNYDKKYFAFGNDAFDKSFDHYAFNSSGSIMQLYKDDYLLQMMGGKTIGLYNYKEDPYISKNLVGKIPDIQGPLETKLHAILQTYNERLIDNNMTIK